MALELSVGGQIYTGWTEITIDSSMRAPAAAFSLSARDPAWQLIPNAAAVLKDDGEAVVTGYIDRIEMSVDAGGWGKDIQGRSLAGDLVDCAAVHSPDYWRGTTLGALARIICAPFGVPVHVDVDGPVVQAVKLKPDETAADALQRFAKIAGRVVMPHADGGIVITTAAKAPVGRWLSEGLNVIGASGVIDYSQRFSEYRIRAQAPAADDDEGDVEAEVKLEGVAKDARVARYRPWRQTSPDSGSLAQVTDRANWEAKVRAAKSAAVEVTVNGWRQDGALWAPNTLVEVELPSLRLTGRMLIEAVSLTLRGDARRAQLSLVSPDAYSPEPVLVKPMTGDDPWGSEDV
jgi:prophage tail gpP-like protein